MRFIDGLNEVNARASELCLLAAAGESEQTHTAILPMPNKVIGHNEKVPMEARACHHLYNCVLNFHVR